jgi:radical SAM superfamily enzyme YgiQ (UPF0313 family)/wyosine [tRNA(Phe)-imidazoG37] synthetase (radical SAM superfamily)
MKVALVQCPVWGTYDPPLALAQLSACLRKEGHKVSVFDLNIELYLKRTENYKFMWAWEQCEFWFNEDMVMKFFEDNKTLVDEYINKIINTDSKLVCFSVNNASLISSLKLARLIKERNKDVLIVFGGPLFFEKQWIEGVLKEECVDIVVFGEGEDTICELPREIEEREGLNSCPGLAFRNNGKIIINKPRPYIKNLNNLPFLDFSGLPFSNYDDPWHIPFMTSRGCIFKCVFCSSREFWKGYRVMSGRRIFEEIKYHYLNSDRKLGHIDFLDLLINGDMKSLVEFCDLMIEAQEAERFSINWSANAIIRPEMNYDVLKKLKRAGCRHLIYGIESGSQRILNLMRKKYDLKIADEVLKVTHNANIIVTANFMFGFPGETEEDFEMTLKFLTRNAKYLDTVYPSRTFCAVEEHSYLFNNFQEFDVKANFPNHLYWESKDGSNNYPERLKRCERFCKSATSLGIEVGCGVQSSLELDRWFNLAQYYELKKDFKNTLDCYLNYFELDPKNELVKDKILEYSKLNKNGDAYSIIGLDIYNRLQNAIKALSVSDTISISDSVLEKLGRPYSRIEIQSFRLQNLSLNDKEFEERKTCLSSTPRAVFIEIPASCNSSCAFCSRGRDYEIFDLETYRKRFEEKLYIPLLNAEHIILTGSGEFLQLPEANKILDYFDTAFPPIDKMFSTNGSSLVPWVAERFINSLSNYTIYVSLHASNSTLHKTLTRTDNFHKILGQIENILKLRRGFKKQSPIINLIFVATTLNIEDLPNFVRLAHNLGVDKVICYYNYIYIPTQKYLSCFFKQDLTNKMLFEAEELADKLNLKLSLPPKFKQNEYPNLGICREPFSQIMFTSKGHVLPCDASEDCNERLENVEDFRDIWNSNYYQNLRRLIIKGNAPCVRHCLRANPSTVNDFQSHVVLRGHTGYINLLWGDNF